ncbi:hypothetical protein WEI85_14850 [Actinomycetes bacterium KLBMP 9797]
MRPYTSIEARAHNGRRSARLVYNPEKPAEAAKVEPLLAVLGAGYDGCVECIDRHVEGFCEQRLLLVWLAFSVATQVGRWRRMPVGRSDERAKFLASHLGRAAATIVDALYVDAEWGIEAAYAAAEDLQADDVEKCVRSLVRAVFTSIDNVNLKIWFDDLPRMNTSMRPPPIS